MPAYKTVITVGDVNDKLDLGYRHIEVWASEDEGGTYREITAPVATSALFYSAPFKTEAQVVPVVGLTVGFSFDNAPEVRVTFSDTIKEWTLPLMVAALNQALPGRFSVMPVGRNFYVVGASVATGRAASVACTYSEAPTVFPAGITIRGNDGRMALLANTYIYPYTDIAGKEATRYKWRFSAGGFEPISEFSSRVMGKLDRGTRVPVAIGTARFVTMEGQPIKRRIIFSEDILAGASGAYVIGFGEPHIAESDESGFLQVTLVQGMRVRMAVEGSALVREFVVPSTDTFDLMTAMAEAEDQFTVQTVPPLLTRRNF